MCLHATGDDDSGLGVEVVRSSRVAFVARTPMLALALLLAVTLQAVPQPRHLVVVTLDDVGVDKVAAYGEHPTAGPTPRLDGFAADGLLFRQAYACPSCSPTRAAALTGRYGSRTGIDIAIDHYTPLTGPSGPFAPDDELPWLPRLLKRSGVRVHAVGKWHLTHVGVPDFARHPIRVGFDTYAGMLDGFLEQTYYSWERTVANAQGASQSVANLYVSLAQSGTAFATMTKAADTGARSFLWLAYSAPHEPWDLDPPPGTFTPTADGGAAAQYRKTLQSADAYLGQLVDAYAAQRPAAAAQTLWIVMGDNGTPNAAVEAPWPGMHNKGTAFQGGIRVPMIAFGAGVQPGETDALVHAVDLWATSLELLGAEPPPVATDSISFAPVLAGGQGARAAVYSRHAVPNGPGPETVLRHAATDGRWKYMVLSNAAGTTRHLYHLEADPHEAINLWPPSTPSEQAAFALLAPVLEEGAASW
jgi:arylsulfatase A-like enzyme